MNWLFLFQAQLADSRTVKAILAHLRYYHFKPIILAFFRRIFYNIRQIFRIFRHI